MKLLKKILLIILCFSLLFINSGCEFGNAISKNKVNTLLQDFEIKIDEKVNIESQLPVISIKNTSNYYFNAQPIKLIINNEKIDIPPVSISYSAKPNSEYFCLHPNFLEEINPYNQIFTSSNKTLLISPEDISLTIDDTLTDKINITTKPDPNTIYPGDIEIISDFKVNDYPLNGKIISIKIRNNTDKLIQLVNYDASGYFNNNFWTIIRYQKDGFDQTYSNKILIELLPNEEKDETIGVYTFDEINNTFLVINGGKNLALN